VTTIQHDAIPNPYLPPCDDHDDFSQLPSGIHHWCGHEIHVECHAVAAFLWMENTFAVTIDGTTRQEQPALRWGDTFRFTFGHDRRLIHARVARDRGLFTRWIKYKLFVDGDHIATSQTPIQGWHLGLAAFLLGVLALFLAFNTVIWLTH